MAGQLPGGTSRVILEAARNRLLSDGYANLSTRKVAIEAAVPLSQLHYHFGSKNGLILALLDAENERRLERQQTMYAEDEPLWQRYERACDYLEDDLESGYVRVLQEMIAAGWSEPAVGSAVRSLLVGWYEVIAEAIQRTAPAAGSFGPFTARELATLVGNAFLGAEALLLLGFDRRTLPIRSSLRRVGQLIRDWEEPPGPREERSG